MPIKAWLILLATGCAAAVVSAQVAVPPELRGWEDWVLRGHETHRCPWLVPGKPVDDERICAWPSALDLQVDEHGARFSQHWQTAAESSLPLPGGAENWPEDVTLDGSPATVVMHGGTPVLRAASGAHSVTGVFRWAHRPELLVLPPAIALVTLSVDGSRVLLPQRTSAGVVLGAAKTAARQGERLDLRVFRRLDDDLPSLLTTELHLAVAGEAREITLPKVLPEGFVPMAVEASLAARLDPDDTLHVQVRPGDFQITIEARGPSPLTAVTVGSRPAPWPAQEIWSFQAQDRLRVAELEGLTSTDPAQANVPQRWRDLPAYRVSPTSVALVVERARGMSSQDANELQLQRTAWLDFSGAGYTIVDLLSGQMRQGWRLDMGAPYLLQSAHTGSGEPLLITEGMSAGLTGVELREPEVRLTAVSLLPRGANGPLAATGWRTRLTRVSGQLVLAPGYRLLAAIGPDSAPQAWLERWRLLDIFAALLIATVAWRMLGVRCGAIALAAIVLTYQESGSPTWLWLNALVGLALLRAAPQGRLRRWAAGYRVLALAALLLVLVPFAITQARLALYPQLEALMSSSGMVGEPAPIETRLVEGVAGKLEAPQAQAAAAAPLARFEGHVVHGLASSAITNAASVSVAAARNTLTPSREPRYEPGAIVQAGPGVPDWRYHLYDYSWSGPVESNATARFLISPPWMTRAWRVLGLLLSVWFLLELTRKELPLPPWRRSGPVSGLVAFVLGVTAVLGTVPAAHAASTPDPGLLSELEARLLAPPKCVPDCADIQGANVTIESGRLRIVLIVSALDAVGVALPGAEPNWSPDLVQIDGAAAGAVYRSPRGTRYVSVARGRHVVRVEGPLGAVDAMSVAFPMLPHVIDVSAPGWDSGGVAERHLVSGALQLARRRAATDTTPAAARQEELPPFVSVERLFHLAHEWTVDTTVTRIAPKSAAFTVSVPLLAQEAITTPGLKASDHRVTVGLAAGQWSQAYASNLPAAQALELTAPVDSSQSEHWRFDVGSTWHVEFSGVPPVVPAERAAVWIFEYYPRPGERLKLSVTRPAATSGSTLAFDHVRLQTVVGKRSSDSTLGLEYRSTQGGRHSLHIPADAVVTKVLSDGEPLALRPEHGELSLSALPGAHSWSVNWQTSAGEHLVTRSPAVGLAAPASNLQLSLRLPEDRWLLYAFGPGVGPTVLYWGELLLFLIAAWLIGRTTLTPLAARDWLLLGLGLSTFSWLVLGLFVVFVAVFEWRARHAAPADSQRFRLLQVGSGILAIIAIVAVISAVPQGLLAHPDMRIAPEAGPGELTWFVDRAAAQLPAPAVLSVSLWWYKIAMLAWALWLSFALTRWVRWAWRVFTRDGLWQIEPADTPQPQAPASR